VIGAGAIGLELGSVYNRLGSKVIFVELLSRIAPFAESSIVIDAFKVSLSQGMEFKLERKVVKGEIKGGKSFF